VTRSVEIPDAAVEAGVAAYVRVPTKQGYVDNWDGQFHAAMRAALVAARPYLMPTREALVEAAHRYYCVKKDAPTHPFDQEDYDKADEILEILAQLNGSEVGS
jgi:hypothetical protein